MAKFKDILKKLSFFGDFSAFLLPLVLIIIAGLLFLPTTLMQRKLRAQIEDQSIKKGASRIDSLLRNAVSSKQWEKERDYQNLYQIDANGIALLAEETSRRQLLSYVIFPEPDPNETSSQIYTQFGRRFREVIDTMFDQLKARDCPTQLELDKQLKKPTDSSASVSPEEASRSNTDKMIIDDLCMRVARTTNLYANRTSLTGYKFWETYNYRGAPEAVTDCWYWQLASWIIEDVLTTAENVNGGYDSVLGAPLKRIVTLAFTNEEKTSDAYSSYNVTPFGFSASSKDRPRYVLSFNDGLVKPFNARICNDKIDVVHFRLSVIVSSYAVPKFLTELCSAKDHIFTGFKNELKDKPLNLKHNQITVLACSIAAVSPESDEHKLYRYGNDSVVKMDLVCEYDFNKAGYDQIKPKVVKDTTDKALKKSGQSGLMSGIIK